MQLKVIITGSTGMIGSGVLAEVLRSPLIDAVLVINRHTLNLKHPKLKEIIQADFFDLSGIRDDLSGYNACFFCLGVSSAGISREDYNHLTYDLTLNFARELLELNPGMTFCYISGAGTDSTEKGRLNWARVKGKTENSLLNLGFKDAYMFRPGFVKPMKGVKSRTALYNTLYSLFAPLYPLLMAFPKLATDSETLGRAMIQVASFGFKKKILESSDINSF